jgi:uracil phosphoribosyltransferase
MNDRVSILNHPLVQNKVAHLRDINTNCKEFREVVEEVAQILAYESTRDLKLVTDTITTPICQTDVKVIRDQVDVVSIMRAGNEMVEGVLNLIPNARVGHLGMSRNHETFQPDEYYNKLPDDIEDSIVLAVDPMLATGNTAVASIGRLKEAGAKNIKFLCIIAAPEGLENLSTAHPDIEIWAAAKDSHLDEHKYIVPGLGDAGDRANGTNKAKRRRG